MKGMLIFNYPQNLRPDEIDPVLSNVKQEWPDWHLVVVPSFQNHSTAEFCACDPEPVVTSETVSGLIEVKLPVTRMPRGPYKPRKKKKGHRKAAAAKAE